MTNGVFNIAKGAAVEMFRDSAAKGIAMLLKANEVETTLGDYADVAALLVPAGNTEAVFTNYARKTGITGTITVDNVNDRVDIDIPDQTWAAAGGASNDTLTKLVVAYENAAADANRVPLVHLDFATLTDGSDITAKFNASGIFRAA